MSNKFEKDNIALESKLVDYHAKPPRAQTQESNGKAQMEQLQQLKDQVHYLQEENYRVGKQVAVQLRAEISKQMRDNEKL